jgi:chromosome segregation ATPase
MATVQFEFERLYDLVKETQEQRDALSSELEKVHDTLESTREQLDLTRGQLDLTRGQLDLTQGQLDLTRDLNEDLRLQNAKLREFVKQAEYDNYALNHRLECLKDTYHTTYEYLKGIRKENKMLEKQIESLTDCSIRYKRSVDPDDLEEYAVNHKIYLRDILTDAVYTRRGKLVGYINEDSGELVKIRN